MKKASEIVIDYRNRECVNCGEMAFIPLLVTELCQECWCEEKDVQYFSPRYPAESPAKRFTGLQGAI